MGKLKLYLGRSHQYKSWNTATSGTYLRLDEENELKPLSEAGAQPPPQPPQYAPYAVPAAPAQFQQTSNNVSSKT